MKKQILLLLVVCCAMMMQAKEKFGVDFGVGVKGGLNFNTVTADSWKQQYSTDPHAGFFAYLNKYRLGIQLEGIWSQNAMTTDSSFYGLYNQYYNNAQDSLKKGTFRFTTISIPLLLNIKLAPFLWLQGGPQYSANVNVIDEDHILKSGRDIIKAGNFNLLGGLWFQLGGRTAPFHVNAGIRYISGINNLSNLDTVTGANEEWRNQMIQVHIGVGL